MRIESEAGDFDLDVESLSAQGDDLAMNVKMGIWDAKMHISSSDLGKILIKALRPSVLLFLLLLPVRALWTRPQKDS
ncbi:MAG: hypothetical protein WEB00_00585 [Dehalococcoidia bacterium]